MVSVRLLRRSPHAVDHVSQLGDFRLNGAVPKHRRAFGERCSHDEVFRAGDGFEVERKISSFEPLHTSLNVAVLQFYRLRPWLQGL